MNVRSTTDRRGLEQHVLQTIDEQNTAHVGSLDDVLDAGPVTIDQQCFELQQKGLIRPIGSGNYQLTPEGKHRLRRLHALKR